MEPSRRVKEEKTERSSRSNLEDSRELETRQRTVHCLSGLILKASTKDLKFRSKAEVKIMQEFEKYKKILIFPLPAAVCGSERKEPDFLVCYKGKWTTLEIVSDKYHPSVEKEANRTALFQDHNVQVRQFSAKRCLNEPYSVVIEFLKWLRDL